MISIERYTADCAGEWNDFVAAAKNGTFLFNRGYMDYHADRFADHSLLYRNDKGKLIAVMPGHARDGEYFSHHGLTYGGFVSSPKLHLAELGEIFRITAEYLREQGFTAWHYKQVPSCFHRIPSEEDSYWLWRMGAQVERCDMAQCIGLKDNAATISSNKRNRHNKLLRDGYVIQGSRSEVQGSRSEVEGAIRDFWPILEENLMSSHQAHPVHTPEEMLLLQSRFPENIKCWTVKTPDGKVVAGTVLYLTDTTVHSQYISASPEGKACHAIDLLFTHFIDTYRKQGQYSFFDFGTSMLPDHMHFDPGLVMQKEEFGARGIAYREYKIELT